MKISFICPSRDNLKYLKWSYESVQKNKGDHTVEFCVADDASTDGTWEWCVETEKIDPNFKWLRNEGPTRLGHTILYDRIIKELATSEICIIWHADMYLCPSALDAIKKHMYSVQPVDEDEVLTKGDFISFTKYKTICSLTRIEPPLHPPGPEKITADFGTEPENFDEEKFLEWFKQTKQSLEGHTEGVFAPWAFFKKDFLEIGGHDPLYAPQSKEDSDIFNRFQLNDVKFIQTWEGFVYHMTCRGSRFNPTITEVGKNSTEWERQNLISTRNFIRKWGHFVAHDEFMKPIIYPKYRLAVLLGGSLPENTQGGALAMVEPWCDTLVMDVHDQIKDAYIKIEQPTTPYNLARKIIKEEEGTFDDLTEAFQVVLAADVLKLGSQDIQYLHQISGIVEQYTQSENIALPIDGKFELGNWTVYLKIFKEPDMKALITDVCSASWKTNTIYTK